MNNYKSRTRQAAPGGPPRWCDRCQAETPTYQHPRKRVVQGKETPRAPACRDCHYARCREHYHRLRDEVIGHYGSACACCGESEKVFLALDHIGGGGNKHRKAVTGRVSGGGAALLRWIKNQGFPTGFRVLCHNCNTAESILGACPHRPKI